MKKYLLDKALFIFLAIIVGLGLSAACSFNVKAVNVSVFMVVIVCFYCKQLFLFLIDVLLGKKRQIFVYVGCWGLSPYDILRKNFFAWLSFGEIEDNEKDHILILPLVCSNKVICKELPQQDAFVELEYYRLSRLICSLTVVNEHT